MMRRSQKFQSQGDHSVSEIYEQLAFEDIRNAADALRPVYDRTQGTDGYISLECSPYLANDTEATLTEAQQLWRAVARHNLMVKVPATKAGLPAIRALIAQGINVNITLLFSVDVYEQVADAYMSGLEELPQSGRRRVAGRQRRELLRQPHRHRRRQDSTSRTDDAQKQGAAQLKGKVAIANAKLAYAAVQVARRCAALGKARRRRAQRPQRLLWASTGTKNPDYQRYALCRRADRARHGQHHAARDARRLSRSRRRHARRDRARLAAAHADLAALADYGVSLDDVTTRAHEDGVRLFADAFDKLLGAVAQRRLGLLDGPQPGFAIGMNSCEAQKRYEEELETWRKNGGIRRLWAGDASLWTGADEDQWLGWLRIVDAELAGVAELEDFAAHVEAARLFRRAAPRHGRFEPRPEVFGETFGRQPAWPKLHVLDSTDPAQIAAIEAALDLGKTLFIVSRKSGGTLEPNILKDYFFERVAALRRARTRGEHFIAVTDPGSSLEKRAREQGFARYLLRRADDRRALFGAVAVSASSRRRRWGSTCGACWKAPR